MLANRKIVCLTLILTVLFSGLLFVNLAQGTNVASLISTNTTWTLSGSPYTLTGPTAVGKGVVLTIEPGVTVNLNNFYIQINGTLTAQGNINQRIVINGGRLIFTENSNGWSQQKGTGNIIEYANINQTEIKSDNALKLNNDNINGLVNVGDSSVLTNNDITYQYIVTVGALSIIKDNTITAQLQTEDHTIISHNILKPLTSEPNTENPELTTWGSCTITDNTITGYHVMTMWAIYNYAIRTGSQTIIFNNKITGIITGSPSEITGNSIEAGGKSDSWDMMSIYTIYAVSIDSDEAVFTSNIIKGTAGGAVHAKSVTFTSNNVLGNVEASSESQFRSNTIVGGISGGGLFQNNRLIDGGINLASESTVKENSIEHGDIHCTDFISTIQDNRLNGGGIKEAAGTIQHNQITNSMYGIRTSTKAISIQDNTLTNNTVGIEVNSNSATVKYNNIEESIQNSLILSTNTNLNAANNWWGTSDIQEINNGIYDFKDDFNVGTVEIKPILPERNQEALPKQNLNLPSNERLTADSPMYSPTTSGPISPTEKTLTPTQAANSETQIVQVSMGTILTVSSIVGILAVAIALLVIRKTTKK